MEDTPIDIPDKLKEDMIKAAALNGSLETYRDEEGNERVRGFFIL